MARFYLPGDPYFPNQGNGGWLGEEPKEEPKVINPPYIDRVPANCFDYIRPVPCWATVIEGCSRQQRPRSPFGDQQGGYDLNHGGPTGRALPMKFRRIANIGDQNKEIVNQVQELRATTAATISQTRDLEKNYHFRDQLIKHLLANQGEGKRVSG